MPLILLPIIILYFVLVIWGTIFIVQRQTTSKRKWLFAVLLPVLFFIGPFADEFVARPYFYYLCESKGGLKVYETVKLDKSFFDENGKLKFLWEAEHFEHLNILKRYKGFRGDIKKHGSVFNIRERKVFILDAKKNKILAEHNMYLYGYGFLLNGLSVAMPSQPIICDWISNVEIEKMLTTVFINSRS